MPQIIAITGGIGSGKSIVSKILSTWGYPVFDCDREAKALMDSSDEIKRRISNEIAEEAIENGFINRKILGELVFNDSEKLRALNAIVHAAVKLEISRWAQRHSHHKFVFIETAILYTSGLDRQVDVELHVTAPEDLRIARVIKRNGLSAEHISARIVSQTADTNPTNPLKNRFTIDNSGGEAILPQIVSFLGKMV